MFVSPKLNIYNSNVGGINELNQDDIKNQNKALILNERKKHSKIKKPINTNNFADNLEQITNTHNIYQDDKINYFSNHKKEYVNEGDLNDIYNPITEEQRKKGLINNNITRFNTHYINIDSQYRQIKKSIKLGDKYILSNNPFKLEYEKSIIYITHPNHTFNIKDKITIEGIESPTYRYVFDHSNFKDPIEFNDDFKYALIKQEHNISEISQSIFYCGIQNFTNPPNNIYIGNIPLTFINQNHKIILSIPNKTFTMHDGTIITCDYDPSHFFIELPYDYKTYIGDNSISTNTRVFELKLYYINNIPIHKLNASYPTNIYRSNNYYVITNIDNNGYYIDTFVFAYWNKINITDIYRNIGGDHVRITKVEDFNNGYPEPNKYTIKLNNSYKNIVQVKLISSEFPCTENTIYKLESNKSNIGNETINDDLYNTKTYVQNNKLYWQNYEDGNYTYSIEITPGKYNSDVLAQELHDAFYNTSRYYYDNQLYSIQPYTNHNYIDVSIDTDKDLITFKSYFEYILKHAIKGLFYIDAITSHFVLIDSVQNKPSGGVYPLFLFIQLANHSLILNNEYSKSSTDSSESGNNVIFTNIINYMGISGSYLNNEFEAYQIPENNCYNPDGSQIHTYENQSVNYFMIKLPIIDIDVYLTDNTNDGGIFYGYIAKKFRLLFDKNDTMGDIIGFKNVGSNSSVTSWNTEITNKMEYEPDIGVVVKDDDVNAGNAIVLSGHNYILMICDQFPVLTSLTYVKSVFAKIQLTGMVGKVIYNSFVQTPKIYFNPINEINELSFGFYSPSGELYDFNGVNHSFTIEITTLDEIQIQTNISSHTGNQI
jgi:hypothetical protein